MDSLSVVVGLDDQPGGWAALRVGADLAGRLGVPLDVAHVVTVDDTDGVKPTGFGALPVPAGTPEEERAIAATMDRLRKQAESELHGLEVGWKFHRLDGDDPAGRLVEFADEVGAYCIVVGAKDPGLKAFFERFGRPSVTKQLTREPPRPVVVVPAPGVDYQR